MCLWSLMVFLLLFFLGEKNAGCKTGQLSFFARYFFWRFPKLFPTVMLIWVCNFKLPNHHWPLVGLRLARTSLQPKEHANAGTSCFSLPFAALCHWDVFEVFDAFSSWSYWSGEQREQWGRPGERLSLEPAAWRDLLTFHIISCISRLGTKQIPEE